MTHLLLPGGATSTYRFSDASCNLYGKVIIDSVNDLVQRTSSGPATEPFAVNCTRARMVVCGSYDSSATFGSADVTTLVNTDITTKLRALACAGDLAGRQFIMSVASPCVKVPFGGAQVCPVLASSPPPSPVPAPVPSQTSQCSLCITMTAMLYTGGTTETYRFSDASCILYGKVIIDGVNDLVQRTSSRPATEPFAANCTRARMVVCGSYDSRAVLGSADVTTLVNTDITTKLRALACAGDLAGRQFIMSTLQCELCITMIPMLYVGGATDSYRFSGASCNLYGKIIIDSVNDLVKRTSGPPTSASKPFAANCTSRARLVVCGSYDFGAFASPDAATLVNTDIIPKLRAVGYRSPTSQAATAQPAAAQPAAAQPAVAQPAAAQPAAAQPTAAQIAAAAAQPIAIAAPAAEHTAVAIAVALAQQPPVAGAQPNGFQPAAA
ncbi:hypothetical protein HXX76_011767 [Chlamydomonas incerta]|uniref:Uncharacterized protein n=1 Tax=Chlamydomonas incerta TaxID=51695 RepID=A0A835SKA2_CHLIN|nr:hypothetical protein HXX76_011767 [Chlamydomonas incerta]|eukprot:KAG2426542.1 hypothetical protein HXX76_011767 [Chlamydomonas incerta]